MNAARRQLAAQRLAKTPEVLARLLANKPVAIADLDPVWAQKYGLICSKFWCTNRPRRDSDLCPEHWYETYLRSPHWQRTRKLKLQQVRHCERCGDWRHLEVHHRTYARVGAEEMTDLEVLCADCHDKHHQENG